MSNSLPDVCLFVAAFEEQCLIKAARRENSTLAHVSQQVRTLEAHYGVLLFSSTAGNISPTPAGQTYYRHCIDILRAHADANEAMRNVGHTLEGEVLIGLSPTMTRFVMPAALARFLVSHPKVNVRVQEDYGGALIERTRSGELSFSVLLSGRPGAGLRSRPFCRTPEVLVAAPSHGLVHRCPVQLSTLGPIKVIMAGLQNPRRLRLDAYFAANNVNIERVLQVEAPRDCLELAAESDWYTIATGLMMSHDLDGGRWSVCPIVQPALWADMMLIESVKWPIDPATAAFLMVLEEETHKVNSVWNEPV